MKVEFQVGSFKEKDENNKYYFDGAKWVKCGEEKIMELWTIWVISSNAKSQYIDEKGYIVFTFKS
jgi:hypothetical protein